MNTRRRISPEQMLKLGAQVVRPYSAEYAVAHAEFARRMFGPQLPKRADAPHNRWKFRGPAVGELDHFLLAVIEGKVVGQIGMIPVRLRIQGRVYPAQWACDLMVDDQYRMRGIGPMLVARGIARDVITLGSSPSAIATPLLQGFGFQTWEGPAVMSLPLKFSRYLRGKLRSLPLRLARGLGLLGQPAMRWICRHVCVPQSHFRAEPCHWRDVMSRIEAAQQVLTVPHIVHDREFLEWRCLGMTGYTHALTALRVADGGYAVLEWDGAYQYVSDWHARSPAEAQALFHGIYLEAQQRGACAIVTEANGPEEQALLAGWGFGTDRREKIMFYPADKLPLEGVRFHYSFYDSDWNI